MLAISDPYGIVSASIPGLASVANVSVDETRNAVKNLLSPDPDSRTKDYEGRRIEEIDGGWRILNYVKYRKMLSEAERADYKAKWIREKRRQMSTLSTQGDANGQKSTAASASSSTSKSVCTKEEVEKFFENQQQADDFWDYYQSNGWRVGRNPMKDWQAAARKWKRTNYGTHQKHHTQGSVGNNRNVGTLNEGKASQYRGVGKVEPIPDLQ